MNDPLPLNELPGYLKNKDTLNPDNSILVDMGKIEKPRQTNYFVLLGLLILLGGAGFLTYGNFVEKNASLVLTVKDVDAQQVEEILKSNGAKITSIKQNEENYEIELSTRKNLKVFVENLKKNKNIIDIISKN